MKAVVFEGIEVLKIAEMPVPECGPGEVLLQVAACGICGGDVRTFFVGDKYTGQKRIPGHEVTGRVTAVGAGVADWQLGDRLALAADIHCGECFYCRRELYNMCVDLKILGKHMDGGLTDYLLLTREILQQGIVNPIPPALSFLHAALSEPLCSILASHEELQVQAGETVVILGSGPMGVMHFELLRQRQARPVLVDVSEGRLARAREDFGATLTIDASRENAVEAVMKLTEGIGADVVITAAPSASAVAQSVELVRKRGRVGLFGGLPAAEARVSLDINRVHYSELRLVGNFSYHPAYHVKSLELLAGGGIRADKLITSYPLEETGRALQEIRQGKVFKAVVIPNKGALL
jgi:L-iditol 2-dehydrogenase